MNRVHSIDYLRGVLALLIMFYHYSSWHHLFTFDSASFLTRNAFYGVSLFFVISGFSLTIGYMKKFENITKDNMLNFFIRRFGRIYPLFLLIVITYILLLSISGKSMPNFLEIITNLTISFSFFPNYYALTTGGWSIGIEIVFYIFFPFIIWFLQKTNLYGLLFSILSIIISIYISSYLLYDISDSKDYWTKYLSLINHTYFFIFGILVAYLYIQKNNFFIQPNLYIITTFLFTLFLFIFYPIEGEVINLLLKENRVILTLLVFIIFILVVIYNNSLNHNLKIFKIFNFFGEISYTIYLIHPIIHRFINRIFVIDNILKLIIAMFITIVVSKIIYNFYEMKIQTKIILWSKKYVSK